MAVLTIFAQCLFFFCFLDPKCGRHRTELTHAGVCMPAVLGVYEIGCLLVLERTFLREFVKDSACFNRFNRVQYSSSFL